ncbi:hypothetical protein G6F23_007521 [Rhizopus arrhizus]|nr:hypothetical protein G6F23_007521 [Rhizopus arrhizus]
MIPFYAEELGNINILRATIITDCNLAESLEVKDNVLSFNSTVIANLSTVGLTISTQNLFISPVTGKSAWEIKVALPKQDQQSRSHQTEVKEWWSTSIMNKESQKHVCKICQSPLFETNTEYKYKDLPSEHWYELVESWICHEEKPEEHKTRMKPILARPKLILVGSTYFLIHPSDVIQNTIEMDSVVSKRLNWDRGTITKWTAISCKSCQHAIGEGQYCMEDFFVSDLINTAKIHATHKFIIQGRQSEHNFAFIWLFNWDTSIIYNDVDTSLKRKRVIKVMYLDCLSKDNAAKDLEEMWSNDKSTDLLIYPDFYCKELILGKIR